jgi:hypothetical protein
MLSVIALFHVFSYCLPTLISHWDLVFLSALYWIIFEASPWGHFLNIKGEIMTKQYFVLQHYFVLVQTMARKWGINLSVHMANSHGIITSAPNSPLSTLLEVNWSYFLTAMENDATLSTFDNTYIYEKISALNTCSSARFPENCSTSDKIRACWIYFPQWHDRLNQYDLGWSMICCDMTCIDWK